MKRFHELTPDQKEEAIRFAAKKIHETVNHGVIIAENLNQKNLRWIAEVAAEEAWYSEKEDFIVDDIIE